MNNYQLLALAMLLGSIPFTGLLKLHRKGRGLQTPPRPVDPAHVLACALDAAKVFVPVFLASRRPEAAQMWIIAAAVAVVGVLADIFPYWLMFRPQGRGLAAALGVVFGLSLPAGLGTLVVWLAVLLLSGRLSLAALVASVSVPIWMSVFKAPGAYVWIGVSGCAYVIMVHSYSIARLLDGSEPRWYKNN